MGQLEGKAMTSHAGGRAVRGRGGIPVQQGQAPARRQQTVPAPRRTQQPNDNPNSIGKAQAGGAPAIVPPPLHACGVAAQPAAAQSAAQRSAQLSAAP